jgi:hypothetical protein
VFLLLGACSSCEKSQLDPLISVPIDPLAGTSSIVFHRPQAVGTQVRQQGIFKSHHRVTALSSGYVVHQELGDLQLSYDLAKTLLEVDLDGTPTRIRYKVSVINASNADTPSAAVGQGGIVRLQGPQAAQATSSSGQVFDLARREGHTKVTMLKGQLNEVEEDAITDPLGPGYELWFEEELAHLFGTKAPRRIGEEWDIDLERATFLLERVGQLAKPTKLSGKATFVGVERLNGVKVQRIEAWIKGEGEVQNEITFKKFANNNLVDVKYTGLFPVDLALPPVEQDWTVKGKGHIIAQINDDIGDIVFETSYEHATSVSEIRR